MRRYQTLATDVLVPQAGVFGNEALHEIGLHVPTLRHVPSKVQPLVKQVGGSNTHARSHRYPILCAFPLRQAVARLRQTRCVSHLFFINPGDPVVLSQQAGASQRGSSGAQASQFRSRKFSRHELQFFHEHF